MSHYLNVRYGLDINSTWGVTGITNNSALTWNEGRIVTEDAIKRYVDAQIVAASGVSQLNDLTDVSLYIPPFQDQFLIYSGGSWRNAYRNLGDLYDVTLSGLTTGDLIAWNTGTTQWENVQTIDFEGLTGLTNYYTKTESDDRFVNVTGDTMTGTLIISGAGYLQLTNEQAVNQIVTEINAASTDEQLPTAAAVYNAGQYYISSAVTYATSAATFIHLIDTINTYNANRVLYESENGVIDSANFTFDDEELKLSNDAYLKINNIQFKNTSDGLLIGNKSGETAGSNIVMSLNTDGDSYFGIDTMPLGTYNIIFGTDTINSGFTGDHNILIGRWVGWNLTTGDYNVYAGYQTGARNEEGIGNVSFGRDSGVREGGDYNVDVGYTAGNNYGEGTGNYMVNIGYYAGSQYLGNNPQNSNEYSINIGYNTGKYADADRSIFMGHNVGYSAHTHDTIYIDTQYRVDQDYLFHGDGANRKIYLNGTVAIKSGVTVAVGEFINDFSDDDTLADASHTALVTEWAIKQYVDSSVIISTSAATFLGLHDVDIAAYVAGYIPFEHSSGMTHSSDLRIDNDQLIIGYNTTIQGDLYVSGTTTTIHVQDLAIFDNIIVLNSGETGAGVTKTYSGLKIDRGTVNPFFIVYDETYDYLTVGFSSTESSLPVGLRRVPEMQITGSDPEEGTLLFYSGSTRQYIWDSTFYYNDETNTFNVENIDATTIDVDDLTVNNNFTLGNYTVSGITNNSGLTPTSQYTFATTYAIKNYIDNIVQLMNSGLTDEFVNVTGDIMTGTLVITGGSYLQLTYGASINEISEDSGLTDASQYAVVTEEALSLRFDDVQQYLYFLNSGLTNVYTIPEANDIFVFVTGDTMTGDLIMDSASIIISGLGYLQLPIGTTINEISTDSGFTNVTDDMISTSLAIKNYIIDRIERIRFTGITSSTNIDIFTNLHADGAVWHYTVKSGITNLRTGTILGAWTTSDVEWNEYSTGDIGNTSDADFSVTNSAGLINLVLTPSSGYWDVLLSRNWI